MTAVAATAGVFVREQFRTKLAIALMILIPAIFVIAAASVLSQFATALGGSMGASAATTLAAGWAAAFIAGSLGFFQAVSSQGADRRLALAGMGAARMAMSRLLASFVMAVVITSAAFITLALRQGILHPAHTVLAIGTYALIYIAIGTLVAAIIHGPLEGSLTVVLIFMLDAFSGPGMSPPTTGLAMLLTPSRKAGELLLAAGGGQNSPPGDWLGAALTLGIAIAVAVLAFWLVARARV